MKNLNQILLFLLLLSTIPFSGKAQTNENNSEADHSLIYKAVEDYVLGLYLVEPERIQRSVDTSLHKIGYYDYDGKAYYHMPMTYKQLYELSAKWNLSGEQANDMSPKEIEIYQVYDRTASARLIAKWGIDLMHLSKDENGKWKIMNIMWQSKPK